MIKINDKEYKNYDIKVHWGNFEAKVCGEKVKGEAPFVKFNIDNNIFIGLEFVFSKDMFINFELNKVIDLNHYISDITYEDEKGWSSIVIGKYDCNMIKTSEKDFQLNFYVESKEIDSITIEIATNIKLL